jgi:hypothetical protein
VSNSNASPCPLLSVAYCTGRRERVALPITPVLIRRERVALPITYGRLL